MPLVLLSHDNNTDKALVVSSSFKAEILVVIAFKFQLPSIFDHPSGFREYTILDCKIFTILQIEMVCDLENPFPHKDFLILSKGTTCFWTQKLVMHCSLQKRQIFQICWHALSSVGSTPVFSKKKNKLFFQSDILIIHEKALLKSEHFENGY